MIDESLECSTSELKYKTHCHPSRTIVRSRDLIPQELRFGQDDYIVFNNYLEIVWTSAFS